MASTRSNTITALGVQIYPTGRPSIALQRRKDIQALRALAVLAVVIYHFWPRALPGGFVGVDIFFVISGFLITGHLQREASEHGRISLRSFYARRIKRILPSAYIVAVGSALLTMAILPVTRWDSVTREGLATIVYLQNILLAKDSVDYLAEGTPVSPYRHYWSLSVEEQFYIVLPILLLLALWLAKKRKLSLRPVTLSILSAGFLGSLLWSMYSVDSGDPAAYFLLSTRMWELLAGSLLAIVVVDRKISPKWAAPVGSAGWVVALLAVFFTPAVGFPGLGAVPAVLGSVLVMLANSSAGAGVVGLRVVQYVGNISYNLYLTHWPVLIFLPFALTQSSPVFGVVGILLSVCTAALLYRFVDSVLARQKITPTNAWRTLLAGAVASLIAAGLIASPMWLGQKKQTQHEVAAAGLLANDFDRLGAHSLPVDPAVAFTVAPQVVVPVPGSVRAAQPSGAEGRCKSAMADDFTPTCLFGPQDAALTIALVGDSHIEQYLPAFEELVAREDLQVKTFFHSSCPLNNAQRQSDFDRNGPCATANKATLENLKSDPTIDLIVTSNRTAVPWVTSDAVPDPVTGFIEVWDELALSGKRVVVLQDNPVMLPSDGTTECVVENLGHPQNCMRSKSQSMPIDHQLEAAQQTESAALIPTESWFCNSDTCPAVIGNVLVYRDEQHISVLYSQTLANVLWGELQAFLD